MTISASATSIAATGSRAAPPIVEHFDGRLEIVAWTDEMRRRTSMAAASLAVDEDGEIAA